MAELLDEVEYGRILGSFTAVAEDFGDTVAPDAIPLAGRVVFSPSISHVSFINSRGDTASLYLSEVTASVVDGRMVGSDGTDGVVLLASNSNNVSASVLWTASIYIDPIGPGQDAPEVYRFLIEVSRNEISSLIDVIKANSRVHNVALFHDAIAEAAAKFWERVEAGEFRGNQGPPGPAGYGVGVPGPLGTPGRSGMDGEAGLGGNIIPDGDLEDPGFLVQGDYLESGDSFTGSKSVKLTRAVSRKILIKPDSSYIGGVYVKADDNVPVSVFVRVFGREGDISRVIENSHTTLVDSWNEIVFALDGMVGDQSIEIIVETDGRTVTVDSYTLIDSTVIQGLQTRLSDAKAELDAAMANLAVDLELVDSERVRLSESLNDLAVVLEDADVDLTIVNEELDDLRVDLTTEETRRQEADVAAQKIMAQLDTELSTAEAELAANKILLAGLDTDLATSQEKLTQAETNITKLETETLPDLEQTLASATTAVSQSLSTLDGKLYGATGDVTTAKENISQLTTDLGVEAQAREQLALDVEQDFTERDSRLNAAETALSTAFPEGAINVSAELARTVREYIVEYSVSGSSTVPPTTGWTITSPTRTPGEYIWYRTEVTYGDGVTSVSSAALLTGNTGQDGPQGPAGEDGADGTGVTILGSYDTVSELPASGSPGDAYLVGGYMHVWSEGAWENVGLIQGPEGVPGPAGADGAPTYTWVKYADTSDGLGMSDDPTGKRFIGLSFNNKEQVESTTSADYQWALFEGPEGPEGVKGDDGAEGVQGVGVESITPFYRDLVRGSSAPSAPTAWSPTAWSTTEPEWMPNRELYRTERIRYTDGIFVYTLPTKIAAYAGIDAAMEAANGKNLNTYTDLGIASKPGPAPAPDSSRTVGDIHRNRYSATGEIWAEYQWTGSAWQAVSFGDGVLSSLDVGKVTGGTGAFQTFFADNLIADDATISKLWTDQLVGKTASFNQISIASGNILVDPNGLSPVLRNRVGGGNWSWDDEGKYWKAPSVQGGTTQYNTYATTGSVYDSNLLDPGAMYVIRYEVWVDTVTPGSTGGRAAIYYRRTDGTTDFVGDEIEDGGDTDSRDLITAGVWSKVERFWRAPADVQSGGINFQILSGASDSTEVRIRNPFVGKQAPAVLIEDGAISAQKVNAESVAGAVGQFIDLETSQLIATDNIKTPEAVIDKIWADGLVAKSAQFNSVSVSSGNVYYDPQFSDPLRWSSGEASVTPGAGYSGGVAIVRTGQNVGSYDYNHPDGDRLTPVTGGTTYRISARIKSTVAVEDSGRINYGWRDKDGVNIGSARIGSTSGTHTAGTWNYVTFEQQAPDDAAYVYIGFYNKNTTELTGTVTYSDPMVIPLVGAVLIEDGAVNASKINAESVASAIGTFVTVEAGNIVAGTADIDSLVAQKISASTAAFQTVNADNIVTSTATMDSAVINQIWADGIAAKTATFNKLTVAPTNMIPDPHGKDPDITARRELYAPEWHMSTAGYWRKTWEVAGNNSIRLDTGEAYVTSELSPGQMYVMSYDVYLDAGTAACRYAIRYLNQDGSTDYVGDSTETGGDAAHYDDVTGPGWTTVVRHWTAPSTAFSASFDVQINQVTGASDIRFRNPNVRPSVGAVIIEDGSVSANHLTSDSIDTRHLRAEAITADKIGANEIVAGKIAADAVDTDQLRANAIDADKISANAVIAGKIAAGAVSADTIQANAITAAKINAGAITAQKIEAGSVTAVKIEAGAVTTSKMTANSIHGDRISAGTIDANRLNADSAMINMLWAEGLDAKSASFSRVTVGSRNLAPDLQAALTDGNWVDLGFWANFGINAGDAAFWVAGDDTSSRNIEYPIVLRAGVRYRFSMDMRTSVAGVKTYWVVKTGDATGASGIDLEFSDWSGEASSSYVFTGTETSKAGTFETFTSEIVPATDVYAYIRIFPNHTLGATNDPNGHQWFRNLSVMEMTGSTLIEDGAITTGHITANTINGDRIKAGTLTAEKIIGGSFEGETFTGGTFTGSVVQTSSTAPRAYLGSIFYGGASTPSTEGLIVDGSEGDQIIVEAPRGGGSTRIGMWDSLGRRSLQITGADPDTGSTYGFKLYNTDGSRSMIIGRSEGPNTSSVVWMYDPLGDTRASLQGGDSILASGLFLSNHMGNSTVSLTGGTGSKQAALELSDGNGSLTTRISGNGDFSIANGAIWGNPGSKNAAFGADVQVGHGSLKTYESVYLYNLPSSSGSGNLVLQNADSRLFHNSSSRRYKKNIVDWRPESSQVLALRPRQWQHHDRNFPDNPNNFSEEWYVGFISEEVHDLGLKGLVQYAGDGAGGWRPESLNYERFAAAHQIVLVEHEDKISELQVEIDGLKDLVNKLVRNEDTV